MASNIKLATAKNQKLGKNNWKIQCHEVWQQPNDHVCGPIAVNRFAFELKQLQNKEMTDKKLLQLIESPDTLQDDNLPTAVKLFEYLLRNKLDSIKVQEQAMMKSQDEDDFKQIDEAAIKRMMKVDAKLKQLSIGCTRKSARLKASGNTEKSIEAEKKRLQDSLKSPVRKKRKITNISNEKCFADELCRQQEKPMIMEGDSVNACKCHSCSRPCHYTCIYEKTTEGKESEFFCSKCYQKEVVHAKDASVLFADLLKSATDHRPKRIAISIANDCKKFVNNFIRESTLSMMVDEFYAWDKEKRLSFKKKKKTLQHQGGKKQLTSLDMNLYLREKDEYLAKKNAYNTVINLAIKEYAVSTDGVVKAMCYNAKEDKFFARVNFVDTRDQVQEYAMHVTNEWVWNTYGETLMKKLMDRAENNEFLLPPTNNEGTLATVKINNDKVVRLKYVPEKIKEIKDGKVTMKKVLKAKWKAKLDSGQETIVNEEYVSSNFGDRFTEECKRLGDKRYLPIPVGSSRSSVLPFVPNLQHANAPKIKYQQGDHDTCVFSSLASALYYTGISKLKELANDIHQRSKKISGGINSLPLLRKIVEERASWLACNKVKGNFNWEKDLNANMILVGVMQDSEGSCQHAVTIYKRWVFDSNEKVALPLCRESLDCCTWEVRGGKVTRYSTFVKFIKGWIFYEKENKKRKRIAR